MDVAAQRTGDASKARPSPPAHIAQTRREHVASCTCLGAWNARWEGLGYKGLILEERWHVAVLAEPPPAELDQKLQAIFAQSVPAQLPAEVRQYLQECRRVDETGAVG